MELTKVMKMCNQETDIDKLMNAFMFNIAKDDKKIYVLCFEVLDEDTDSERIHLHLSGGRNHLTIGEQKHIHLRILQHIINERRELGL